MIPKIIHYCWLSNDPIPDNLQKYMKSWRKHLSDYDFILWDLNLFDIKKSLWVQQAFNAKKYAFAADYIRLYAIYNYGGIYMDMDIEVLKTFNDLLDNKSMLAYESEAGYIEAGCFGSVAKSEWIRECLDYYENRSFIKENGEFDMLTLPSIITPIIEKYDLTIFDQYTFTAKSHYTDKIYIKPNTYTVHHFAGSWLTPNRRIAHFIMTIIYRVFGIKFGEFIKRLVE